MRKSSYKKIGAFILAFVLVFTTLFGGLGSLGINGVVEDAYAGTGPTTMFIDKGPIVLTDSTVTGYDSDGNQVSATLNTEGYIISQTNVATSTTNKIKVTGGIHSITLSGINIDLSATVDDSCAFDIQGSAVVNLYLADGTTNTLKSGGGNEGGIFRGYAGLQVAETAAVTIYGDNGTLNAVAKDTYLICEGGAGIGGNKEDANGTITINGGNIIAYGGYMAAGIGGNKATAAGGPITINGGSVNAIGGKMGGGIVGGAGCTIAINGGTVHATAGTTVVNGFSGAGIGGKHSVAGGTITITDGTVTAIGGPGSAGIGAGSNQYSTFSGGNITISGGQVIAIGGAHTDPGRGGAGIGVNDPLSLYASYAIGGVISIGSDATVIAVSKRSGNSAIVDADGIIAAPSGETVANILSAAYASAVTAGTKAEVRNSTEGLLAPVLEYTPTEIYQSIAFSVPSTGNYTLFAGDTIQMYSEESIKSTIFSLLAGLNVFGTVEDYSSYEAVTNITDVTTTGTVGVGLALSGTVAPADATNNTIVWGVKSGTATMTGASQVTATAAGDVVVTATITNGSTGSVNYTQDFTITFSSSAKAITVFSFNGLTPNVAGTINETAKTIALTVPYGTDVTALVPTIMHTGASVSPNTGVAQNFTSPVNYTVTASDTTTQAYVVTVTVAANPAKAITAFSFNGLTPNVVGTVNETAKTVAITVPYGTDVTALVPTITHTGASVSPNTGVVQNFTSPVTYTVTASDTTTQAYVVTVTVAANPAKGITAFSFNGLTPNVVGTVNETAKTVAITVPYGTDVTALVPTITHTGASVSPNTGVAQDFTSPVTYTVTASDTTTQAYVVTVTVAANPAKGITAFSFNGLTPNVVGTVNETAKTVAITVPYGTDVTALVPTITHTGASVSPNTGVAQNFTSPVTYTVTASDTTTQAYVVTVTVAANPAKAITAFSFNGLTPNVAGTVNETAKTVAITVPYGTDVTALVPTITHTGASVSPNTGVAQDFTSPVTYTVTASDTTTQAYVVTVTVAANPAKGITAFSFNGLTPNVVGTVNETAKTVAITVPYGTDVTALVPTITHTGASVSPNTGVAQDFTSPVTYTVTASDTTTQAYVVTVTVAANPAKAITAFSFNGLTPNVAGTVNETAKTVAITVPYGTDVTALVPTITHTGASVSPNTGVAQDFTSPVTYTVTASDTTTQAYVVTVTVAANPAKGITAFSFNGLTPNVVGTVNETAKTVAITVPYGTDVTALVPTITHTGASVSPNTGVAQDFTSPVTYTVTASDTTTQAYVVTVTVTAASTSTGTSSSSSSSGGSSASSIINTNTGSVTDGQLSNAAGAAKTGETVTIKSSKTNEVTFPASGLESLAGKDNSLTVVTEKGTLKFDGKAVTSMGTQATAEDIQVIVDNVDKTILTEDQQEKVGDKVVYDLTVMSGGNLISSFDGGTVNVSIPYELTEGQATDNLSVWYMSDDGNLTEIKCAYDENTKSVTFTVDHFSKYIIGYSYSATWVNPFKDVMSDAWYYEAVAYVNEMDLMKGQTETTFAPQAAMTRGMFVTILGRMEGVDITMYASSNKFSDVDSSQYYAPYIAWASDKGIVSGVGENKFAPNASVTREQMAVMMTNYMTFKEQGPVGQWAIQLKYGDLGNVSPWANEGLMFVTMKGLMKGMGNDENGSPLFAPELTSNRAQTAQLIMNLQELLK